LKLVTNDYGCGTSSSILDYNIKDVVIVSETNYSHIFDVEDDLLFIGHDFLFFLWDNEEKLNRWKSRKGKWEHWVWCFERVDAIVPAWQQKSHYSLGLAGTFCNRILACDEDDCDKYGFDWLPQWASRKFFDKRDINPISKRFLFSGQAGGPEYHMRNLLLTSISTDSEISNYFEITNTTRSLTWDKYVDNLLKYKTVLNPIGILRALNTRAYEVLYAGRILLQHAPGQYRRHQELLSDCSSVLFFNDLEDLKKILNNIEECKANAEKCFEKHSLYARMKLIGVEIK
jgi:hypothetical protein